MAIIGKMAQGKNTSALLTCHTYVYRCIHTYVHTTHTHTKAKKQSVSLPLSGHAIWHSQNVRALSGPLNQCNATSWSRARNSQVD